MIKKLYNKFFNFNSPQEPETLQGKLFKEGYAVISIKHKCIQYDNLPRCLHIITEEITPNHFMVKCLDCEFFDSFDVWEMDYVPSIKNVDFDKLDEM